jgi:hypothetical protein
MHHVEDLSVELEDNMFDQMMLLMKGNLCEHVEVGNERMDKEMMRMFVMAS